MGEPREDEITLMLQDNAALIAAVVDAQEGNDFQLAME